MAKPTGDLLERLGPAAEAFQRHNGNNPTSERTILDGEQDSFDQYVINLTDGTMENVTITTLECLNFETKYLWIINKNGLIIIPENTSNPKASRKVVCHSNITNGEAALQGGELWFLQQKTIVINYKSGRYGAETIIQENAVIEYFTLLGFQVQVEQ